LRILALLTLLHDPKHHGLVCWEEPENGVHPVRVRTLIERLRELLIDPLRDDIDSEEPLAQMLLNSHSPVVLSCLEDGEGLFADMVSVVDPERQQTNRKTCIRPIQLQDQGELFHDRDGPTTTRYEARQYLESVERGA
jgi:predicted ATPase